MSYSKSGMRLPVSDQDSVPDPSRPYYAEVVVDIAAANTDRTFHYMVPDNMVPVKPGCLVMVPFGGRRLPAFVVRITRHTPVPKERLRSIISYIYEQPVITPDGLPLCRWMVKRYLCRFIHALRVMLPPLARRPGTMQRKSLYVRLLVDPSELEWIRDTELKRAPRQRQAIDGILAMIRSNPPGQSIWVDDLRADGQITTGALKALAAKGLIALDSGIRPHPLQPSASPANRDSIRAKLHPPTSQQATALDLIQTALSANKFQPVLLRGVTGSGKTEVYLHAIDQALSAGRGSIVLVPEISLTPQLIRRFKEALGDRVAVLHSGLSDRQRYDEWQRIRLGAAPVVIGARSAVFAPVHPLGLIVVDEEHAASYKQEESPRYHAREVAWMRARLNQAVLLLGSATPALETVFAVQQGWYQEVRLTHRIAASPDPEIQVVDMRQEYRSGNRGLLSRSLLKAIERHLQARGQILLFLNRRGFATALLCRECGATVKCPHCTVSLTYHRSDGRLHCHYCGFNRRPVNSCPQCGGYAIGYFGAGTQRVEQAVLQSFPGVRVARMDADTTRRRGSHEQIYESFLEGKIDVLVGTQMIARGWDIPGVTLVGVIDADVALHLPDFRSAERTFELLVQVAGRAGRGQKPGEVMIQTFNPHHYAIQAAVTGNYDGFYTAELESRRSLGYPPYSELIRLLFSGTDADKVEAAAHGAADGLTSLGAESMYSESDLLIMGPSPAPLARLRGMYRWHLLLKGPDGKLLRQVLRRFLAELRPEREDVRLSIDVNPITLL